MFKAIKNKVVYIKQGIPESKATTLMICENEVDAAFIAYQFARVAAEYDKVKKARTPLKLVNQEEN